MSVLVDRAKQVMELVNLHGSSGSMDLGTVVVMPSDVLDLMVEIERLRPPCKHEYYYVDEHAMPRCAKCLAALPVKTDAGYTVADFRYTFSTDKSS